MARRGRPRAAYSRVYVRGDSRVVVNYANGYVCQMTPDKCTVTKFEDFKRLTPALVERAVLAWGYVLEKQRKGKAA